MNRTRIWLIGSTRLGLGMIMLFWMTGMASAGLRITFTEPETRIYDPEKGRQAQEEAEDCFQWRVDQVNVVQTENRDDVVVMVRGTIQQVFRSVRPCKAGDVIYVRYRTRDETGYEDASDIPILEEGKSVPAFLRYIGADNHYVPAAGAFSFRRLDGTEGNESQMSAAHTAPDAKPSVPQKKFKTPIVNAVPQSSTTDGWDTPVMP